MSNLKIVNLDTKILGFIGFGYMAQSLAKGFISQKVLRPNQIVYYDHNTKVVSDGNFTGCTATSSNHELLHQCEIIIIAVKPQIALRLLLDLRNNVNPDKHLILSICAGITLQQLQSTLPTGTKVVRTMPNTSVSVGMGATVVCGGKWSGEDDCDVVCRLFSSVGLCLKLPESQLNVATAISGSGPAYTYMGLDAVGDAGALLGLPKKDAQLLAAHTMMGAAKMFLQSGQHAGALKDAVCSPGGTTLAGVRSLEKSGFRSVLMEAVVANHDRSMQLETLANTAAAVAGVGGDGKNVGGA